MPPKFASNPGNGNGNGNAGNNNGNGNGNGGNPGRGNGNGNAGNNGNGNGGRPEDITPANDDTVIPADDLPEEEDLGDEDAAEGDEDDADQPADDDADDGRDGPGNNGRGNAYGHDKDNGNGNGNGRQALSGAEGSDVMRGGNAPDTIDGGAGDDIISGGRGPDELTGGEGADTFYYGRGFGPDEVTDFTSGEDVVRINIEGIDGYEDLVFEERDGNVIVRFSPTDAPAEDTVEGGAGDDTTDGSTGDDTVEGATGEDTVEGGTGEDTVDGATGDDSTDGTGDDTPEDGVTDDEDGGGFLILRGVSLDDLSADSFVFGLPKEDDGDGDSGETGDGTGGEAGDGTDDGTGTDSGTSDDPSLYEGLDNDSETAAMTASSTSGDETFTGLEGLDTVRFSSSTTDSSVQRQDDGSVAVASEADGNDLLQGVERAEFSDGTLAFDVDGTAGQAYRLYRAAFSREPDAPGLGHWVRQLDKGLSTREVADGFLGSEEFQALYGTDAGNEAFITALYENVLGRAPDEDGRGHWLSELANGAARSDILLNFSESAENKDATAPVVDDGIYFV